MHKTCYVFIAALLWLASCSEEKKTRTEVSGKVLEYGTTKPLAGAKIILYEGEPNPVTGRLPLLTERQSTISASDGSYSIKYSHLNSSWYLDATYISENYYEGWENGEFHGSSFPPGEHLVNYDGNTQNIYFYPKAWLKLNFIKQSNADYISLNYLPKSIGTSIDTSFLLEVAGNQLLELNLFIMHGTKQTPRTELVQTIGHDTVYHEIKY